MYIYLSKKIEVHRSTKLTCLSWNTKDGYLAVGGEQGLLKVLKLETDGSDAILKTGSLAAPTNLTINQSLQRHTDDLKVLVWNPLHQKLTTSDDSGFISVWVLYKGMWYEEMVNNRKKSTVMDMAWSNDGTRICIVYADGAVIVGFVGGSRVWGKDLKDSPFSKVQWSPDDKLLLFGFQDGALKLFDSGGNFVMDINFLYHNFTGNPYDHPVVGLDWFAGGTGISTYSFRPNILMAHESGCVQLITMEGNIILPMGLDTKLTVADCRWDHTGNLFAVIGRDNNNGSNEARIYTCLGEHIRSLKLPGQSITACSWEEGSLRLAIAIDSAIYFANIRPDYKWSFFKDTLVFVSNRMEGGFPVIFWETDYVEVCFPRFVLPVCTALDSCGEHCIVAGRNEDDVHSLFLCNTIGSIIDTKEIDFDVKFVTMSKSHVVVASACKFLVWQYRTAKTKLLKTKDMQPRLYHTEDTTIGALDITDNPSMTIISEDEICSICVSDKALIIGRQSGPVWHFTFPHVGVVRKYDCRMKAKKIAINCNSTRAAVIDICGLLTVFDLYSDRGNDVPPSEQNRLYRRDVWSMCWAEDDPQLLAIMEKMRMYVFKGAHPEEPISSAGYICSFKNLEIQAILLDEVIRDTKKPTADKLIKLEIKRLRDTRQLLEKVGLKEAMLFIEDNPHPRLWRLLGQAALREFDFKVAKQAFVKAKDYSAIEFIKDLRECPSNLLKKAEIATYLKEFDEAERLYAEADRRDLALEMRVIIGDWFRAIEMVRNGVYASDELLITTYEGTGDFFAERNVWNAAYENYVLAKNKAKQITALTNLEDYRALEILMGQLKERDPLLKPIGDVFSMVGLAPLAIETFLKLGDVNAAVNVSIVNNFWDDAIKIAYRFNLPDVSEQFVDYTTKLLEDNQFERAWEINMKANCIFSAARIIGQYATKLLGKPDVNLKLIKRLYLYSARLIARYKDSSARYEKVVKWEDKVWYEKPWKGAEALTLLILAHTQIYKNQTKEALATTYKLQDYIPIIPEEIVYALLGLAAGMSGAFELCSNAFVRLSLSEDLNPSDKEIYENNAVEIFSQKEPKDIETCKTFSSCEKCQAPVCDWLIECPNCETTFATCMISGKPMIGRGLDVWICLTCGNESLQELVSKRKTCPVCYTLIRKDRDSRY